MGPLIETLASWAAAFVDWIAPQIPPMLSELGTLLDRFLTWITGEGGTAIAAKLVEWGLAFTAWVGPRIDPLLDEMEKLLTALVAWMAGKALTAIKGEANKWGLGIVSDMIDGLGGLRGELEAAIRGAIAVLRFTVGAFTFNGGRVSFSWGDVPKPPDARALGGSVNAGQAYVVGERGPELFVSGSSGSIVPAGGFSSSGTGRSEQHTHLHFDGPVYGLDDLEDVMVRMLGRAASRGRISSTVMA